MTYVTADWAADDYIYIAYNSNKLYLANQKSIKIVAVTPTTNTDYSRKIIRKISEKMVATIDLYKEDKNNHQHKIHGLAVTKDGLRTESNP